MNIYSEVSPNSVCLVWWVFLCRPNLWLFSEKKISIEMKGGLRMFIPKGGGRKKTRMLKHWNDSS